MSLSGPPLNTDLFQPPTWSPFSHVVLRQVPRHAPQLSGAPLSFSRFWFTGPVRGDFPAAPLASCIRSFIPFPRPSNWAPPPFFTLETLPTMFHRLRGRHPALSYARSPFSPVFAYPFSRFFFCVSLPQVLVLEKTLSKIPPLGSDGL